MFFNPEGRPRNNSFNTFASIFLALIALALIGLAIAWLISLVNLLNSISAKQDQINESLNNNTCCDNNETAESCIVDSALVQENYTLFCLTNDSSYNNFFFLVDDLEDKITNGYILKSSACVGPSNLVVYILLNNISKTFPAPNASSNDAFVNGLPNLCGPGTNIGHYGNSADFVNSALALINTVMFNNTALHYDNDSINSIIGKGFLNQSKLVEIKCFIVEVYCYGFNPIYVYTAPL